MKGDYIPMELTEFKHDKENNVFNFTFNDEKKAQQYKFSAEALESPETERWVTQDFLFRDREKELFEMVTSITIYITNEVNRRLALDSIRTIIALLDLPAVARFVQHPGKELIIVDYSNVGLSPKFIGALLFNIETGLQSLETHAIQEEETEVVVEEEVPSGEVIDYPTPLANLVSEDEYLEDDFNLGEVETDD